MKLLLIVFALIVGAVLALGLRIYQSQTTEYPIPTQAIMPSPTPALLDADNLFQTVNNWRIEENYQPYIKSDFACNIATIRLPEVKENWSHNGFHASRFCTNCWLAENLAQGYFNANQKQQLLDDWLDSPSHRKILELEYTHSCIKCDSGYCVHIFSYF